MDAIKGNIIWPFVTIFAYGRFTIGAILCLPQVLVYILQGKKLTKYVDIWNLLSKCYLGSYVFSGIAAFIAPYTSSISPQVLSLRASHCEVIMNDFPWLRNPFGSIHAVALTNLGEFASGLCMLSTLQHHSHLQGIPISIDIEFFKKARGPVTAKGAALLENITKDCEVQVISYINDSQDSLVAKCSVKWSIRVRSKSDEKTNDGEKRQ